MSKLRLSINYKSLEVELQEALKADELYKLQNDAKLRAVEQNVPTYEDFRQMVNAAHLKPLERDDIKSTIHKSWNPIVNIDRSNTVISNDEQKKLQSKNCPRLLIKNNDISKDQEPRTYKQFVEVWKNIEGHETKFNYLKVLRHTLLEKIFRTEIPSELFVELIDVCRRNVSVADNIETIIEILNIFSKCNRFYLAVTFFGQTEKETCTQLFRDLLVSSEYQNDTFKDAIKTLASFYKVLL